MATLKEHTVVIHGNRFGVKLINDEQSYELCVGRVLNDSPAEEKGIRARDRIVSVDDTEYRYLNRRVAAKKLSEVLKANGGATIVIERSVKSTSTYTKDQGSSSYPTVHNLNKGPDKDTQSYLSRHGFGDNVSELSAMGVKSLDDLTRLSAKDLKDKTSLKPLQAKKLSDMIQNPHHPKSPRAASSSSSSFLLSNERVASSRSALASSSPSPSVKPPPKLPENHSRPQVPPSVSTFEMEAYDEKKSGELATTPIVYTMDRSVEPHDDDDEEEEEDEDVGTYVQHSYLGPYSFGNTPVVTMTPLVPMTPRTKAAKVSGCILKFLVKIGWRMAKELNASGGDPSGTLAVAVPAIQFCEMVGVPVCALTNTVMGALVKTLCMVDETPQILISGFSSRNAAESGAEPQVTLKGISQQTYCEKLLSLQLGLYDFYDQGGNKAMYTRRVKQGCCCAATLNYQLVHAEKMKKVNKETGAFEFDKQSGEPIMVDRVLATMKLVKPRKPQKQGACMKSFGALGCICVPCNKLCFGTCDMCCEGIRCIIFCPSKLFLCVNPPDVVMLDQTVSNKDWEQPVNLVSGRLKEMKPEEILFRVDDTPVVTYVPYVSTKKAAYQRPGGTLFKVSPSSNMCKRIKKTAFPSLKSVVSGMILDMAGGVDEGKDLKDMKDECGCDKMEPVKLSDDVVAIDYGSDGAFSAQSKLSAILNTMLDMQDLQ